MFPRGYSPFTGQGGSESGSVGNENAPTNPTLASLIEAWPTLPPDTQRAILAIVEAAQGRGPPTPAPAFNPPDPNHAPGVGRGGEMRAT